MSIITIDPYYDVNFYNETKEALNNNGVEYQELISLKSPYYFYFEVENNPSFINYDEVNKSYSRNLVTKVKPLKPNDVNLYLRRDSYTALKAIDQYAKNDALRTAEKTGQGIFFTAKKEEILGISNEFQRKIWFMGRYFNRKYMVFFTDNLMVKNFIDPSQVLVESRDVSDVSLLESRLNFEIFREKDRLEKLSETPYIFKGKFYPVSIRPEISDKYVL